MSQLSYTGGAPFATSRRGGYDNAALSQAKDMLQRLGSYQAASQSTGVPITVLRETFPNVRRSGFNPASLKSSYVPPVVAKEVPLPVAPVMDNDRIARLVMETIARRYQLRYSDLKAVRGNFSSVQRTARMILLESLSYFTSWNLAKIAEFCGYASPDSAFSAMNRWAMRLSDSPDEARESELIRSRIKSRIVAIVGG